MATVFNNLYPPIFQNTIPAFVKTTTADTVYKIYFSLSQYNNPNEIKNAQVIINDLYNNSILNTENGIIFKDLQIDYNIENDFKYFISILKSDFKNTQNSNTIPVIDTTYKIQIRFTSINASGNETDYNYLENNLQYFSEWSKVGLLTFISLPNIQIPILDNIPTSGANKGKLSGYLPFISGRLIFNSTEKDFLKEYRIKIYTTEFISSQGLIFDSKKISVSKTDNNQIYCPIYCNFKNNIQYKVILSYVTHYGYIGEKNYLFEAKWLNTEVIDISIEPNNEDAYIELKIQEKPDKTGNNVPWYNKKNNIKSLLVRRSSSKDNFNTWEDLFTIDGMIKSFIWNDLTIQSGILYHYGIFVFDEEQINCACVQTSQPVLCLFEDSYLVKNDLQLSLKFNLAITDFKYNVTESQQLTLGSKFPYFRRNGNNFYRTFSISGLISSLMDEQDWYQNVLISFMNKNDSIIENDSLSENENLPFNTSSVFDQEKIIQKFTKEYFTSKEEIYGNNKTRYEYYESSLKLNNNLNPIYEKLYRQAIYNFLYDKEAKLFKSPTEGNILIKLTNIVFEPIASLGRIIYSFSATAIEIDQANFKNYFKYNVISNEPIILVTEYPVFGTYYDNNGRMYINIKDEQIFDEGNNKLSLRLENARVKGGKVIDE